jgi:ADP-heptose:LPS heptosyltransferase
MIGDVINSAHIAETLSSQQENVNVDLLTYSDNRGVAEVCASFEERIYIDRSAILSRMSDKTCSIVEKYKCLHDEIFPVIEKEYDIVYNLTHNKISSIICGMVNAKHKPGVILEDDRKLQIRGENNWLRYFNDFVATDTLNTFQYVDVLRKAIELPCGGTGSNVITNIHFKEEAPFAGEDYFIIKPTTSEASKNWHIEYYVQTAKEIIERTGYNCLVLGTASEKVILDKIKEDVGFKARIGIYDFEDLPEIIRLSQFVLGGDTGILHLASAMKKRTITISVGPGTYYKSTPYGEGNVILFPRIKCYPCDHLSKCEFNYECRNCVDPKDVVSSIIDEKVKSKNCGALKTCYDEDDFLAYQNINSEFKDDDFFKLLENRKIVIEYMDKRQRKEEYSFIDLKEKLTAEN